MLQETIKGNTASLERWGVTAPTEEQLEKNYFGYSITRLANSRRFSGLSLLKQAIARDMGYRNIGTDSVIYSDWLLTNVVDNICPHDQLSVDTPRIKESHKIETDKLNLQIERLEASLVSQQQENQNLKDKLEAWETSQEQASPGSDHYYQQQLKELRDINTSLEEEVLGLRKELEEYQEENSVFSEELTSRIKSFSIEEVEEGLVEFFENKKIFSLRLNELEDFFISQDDQGLPSTSIKRFCANTTRFMVNNDVVSRIKEKSAQSKNTKGMKFITKPAITNGKRQNIKFIPSLYKDVVPGFYHQGRKNNFIFQVFPPIQGRELDSYVVHVVHAKYDASYTTHPERNHENFKSLESAQEWCNNFDPWWQDLQGKDVSKVC